MGFHWIAYIHFLEHVLGGEVGLVRFFVCFLLAMGLVLLACFSKTEFLVFSVSLVICIGVNGVCFLFF